VRFTQNDLAKYTFLKETIEHMKKLGLKIKHLANPRMAQALNCASERVENAILSVTIGEKSKSAWKSRPFLSRPCVCVIFLEKKYEVIDG
jgi:hypothetical protein